MARPRREINWEAVEKLTECGCTGIEIASKFKMDENTFYNRFREHYEMRFSDYSGPASKCGKADIRSMLYAKALNNKAPGCSQLLLFLARCELGMKEPEITHNLAANQNQLDQTHLIMQLQNRIRELEENGNQS